MRKFTITFEFIDCNGLPNKDDTELIEEFSGPAIEKAEAFIKAKHRNSSNHLCKKIVVEPVPEADK